MAIAGGNVENYVPHYDTYGFHHHSHPFKDKSYLLNEEIRHPKWLEPAPAVKSRAELQQARVRGRVPDSSYDFDGDGTVGQLDYFIGKCFDKDHDGRLSQSERGRARDALDKGFLDNYVRGLDATGPIHRCGTVKQRRGVIMMVGNPSDASVMTYPPHHNAHMQPPHNTKTALELSRIAEAKGQGQAFAEKYAQRCAPVSEPQPPNHRTEPRTCPISHISERAEADHQASRVRGGLLPQSTAVNPERELKTVGLGYVEKPVFATRGQLLETRKELMKRDCEELAVKAEDSCVPNSVRKMQAEAEAFEFRRPKEVPMTFTRLKDQRRRDRIEYDMQNFPLPRAGPREYPRFSDNPEVPFWMADGPPPGAVERAAYAAAMSRTVSEPVLKVTEIPFPVRRPGEEQEQAMRSTLLPAGLPAGSPAQCVGSKTVKRWTAECIERGEGRNKPRLFDSIQPVRIGPKDLESLDVTSSMEPIRNAALHRRIEDNRRMAGNPKRSRLYSDASGPQASLSDFASAVGTPVVRSLDRMPGKAIRTVHKSHSDPIMRNLDATKVPHEPRFFGSVEQIVMPASQTAVRSGGFQTFVAPEPKPASQQQRLAARRASRSSAQVAQQ